MKTLFHEGMRAGAFGFAVDKNEEDAAEDAGPYQATQLQRKSLWRLPRSWVSLA